MLTLSHLDNIKSKLSEVSSLDELEQEDQQLYKLIEKHYTLDHTMTGSGHFFAVNPDDLRKMVQNIRLTETVLGEGSLGVAESEKKAWQSARRSIVAEIAIKKGTTITPAMIGLKRPAGGLSAEKADLVIGKKAKQDIKPDQRITLEMLE